jgi:hypothetical protein
MISEGWTDKPVLRYYYLVLDTFDFYQINLSNILFLIRYCYLETLTFKKEEY